MGFGGSLTGSASLPGQSQETALDKAARIGSLIGETAHGVGNVVRAFRGMSPVRYPGKTLAQQAEAAKNQKMRDALLQQLLGGELTPAQDAQMDAETAGMMVETDKADSGAPKKLSDEIADEVPVEDAKENLLDRAKVTRAKPFIDFYYERGEPLPQHIQDMLDGKNTLN